MAQTGPDKPVQQQLDRLEPQYPGLSSQVMTLIDRGLLSDNLNQSITRLSQYAAGAETEIKQALELVIRSGWYAGEQQTRAIRVKVDGHKNDWQQVADKVTDKQGDSYQNRADMDLVGAAAFPDTNGYINLLIECKKPPTLEERIDVLLNLEDDFTYDFQVQVYGWTDGNVYTTCYDLHSKKQLAVAVEYQVAEVFEARFSLAELTGPLLPDKLVLLPRIYDSQAKQIDNAPLITLFPGNCNYALLLLLQLLAEGHYLPGDSITAAIALVNSYIYQQADAATRTRITADCAKHFSFYQQVLDWQQQLGLPYQIGQAEVIPKIFWADRSGLYLWDIRHAILDLETGGRLTMDIYTEFVDSIEVLQALHATIKKKGLALPSLPAAAAGIEEYVHRNRKYRSSMENLEDFNRRGMFSDADLKQARAEYKRGEYQSGYFGRQRRWDEFRWLNYQHKLYLQKGFYQGDCGDTTMVQVGFYKAAGICPASFQWIHPEGIAAYSHNFPAYYHPTARRWYSYQQPHFQDTLGKPVNSMEIYFHYTKPAWHAWVYSPDWELETSGQRTAILASHYQGELITSDRLLNFLTIGWSAERQAEVFLSPVTRQPGVFFDRQTAPNVLTDTDGDGLTDAVEKQLGLDPSLADTDGDGLADWWEINMAKDPIQADNPAEQTAPAIDGLLRPIAETSGTASIVDSRGDSTAVNNSWDVASLAGKIAGESLYLAVEYHNNVLANTGHTSHSFQLYLPDEMVYWAQWYDQHFSVFDARSEDSKNWTTLEPAGYYEMATIRSGEFRLPLSLVGKAQVVFVRYFSGGETDTQHTFATTCDYTDLIRIPLGDDPLLPLVKTALRQADPIADGQGDYKKVQYIKDIKSLSAGRVEDELVFYAAFYQAGGKPFGVHSLLIRPRSTGANYWFQWTSLRQVRLWTWMDGESSTEQTIKASAYHCLPYNQGYAFLLPANLFLGDEVLYVQYNEGSYDDDGKFVSDADRVERLRLDLKHDPGKTAQQPLSEAWIGDPAGDATAAGDNYDIRQLMVRVYPDFIICHAEYYNDISLMDVGLHTIHLRVPGSGSNWWVQWWGMGSFKYYTWKDGENSKEQRNHRGLFDIIYYTGGYDFVIPRAVLTDGLIRNGKVDLEIKYYAGGRDQDGNGVYDADVTDIVLFE